MLSFSFSARLVLLVVVVVVVFFFAVLFIRLGRLACAPNQIPRTQAQFVARLPRVCLPGFLGPEDILWASRKKLEDLTFLRELAEMRPRRVKHLLRALIWFLDHCFYFLFLYRE